MNKVIAYILASIMVIYALITVVRPVSSWIGTTIKSEATKIQSNKDVAWKKKVGDIFTLQSNQTSEEYPEGRSFKIKTYPQGKVFMRAFDRDGFPIYLTEQGSKEKKESILCDQRSTFKGAQKIWKIELVNTGDVSSRVSLKY